MQSTRALRNVAIASAMALLALPAIAAGGEYVPPPGSWASRPAAELGMDAGALDAAIVYAAEHESRQPRDLALAVPLSFAREPFDALIGPTQPRGDPTGLVIRHGYLVAQWGDPDRVDMTFSITKSFLSTVIGVALARGRIEALARGLERRVRSVERHVEEPRLAAMPFHKRGGFGTEQTPAELNSIADLQRLAPILADRGYSDHDINAIFHGNWLRLLRECLPG